MKKAPCLPDAILKKRYDAIDTDVRNLEGKIRSTNYAYCDDRIEEDLRQNAVLLERKKHTFISNCLLQCVPDLLERKCE